jgi:putative spermidine/putrescine transport system permease protein
MRLLALRKLDLAIGLIAATLFFSIPFLASLQFSLRQPATGGFGFDNYVWFLTNPDFGGYLLISLGLALSSALILMVVLVPLVIWINITNSRLRNMMAFVSLMPLIIPVVALAIGAQDSLPTWAQSERSTLAFFYAVLALPYVYRTLDNGLSSVPLQALTEASRSLGANWFVTVYKVVTPAVRTAVIGSVFMTLALSMGEYTLTSLLHWDTFTTWVTVMAQSNLLGSVALSVFSLLIVLVVLLIIGAFVKPTKNSVVMEEN